MTGFGLIHPDQQLQLLHSKTVSNYDLHHKLAFPVRLLGYLWPQLLPVEGSTEFTVLDVHRTPWCFSCKLRRTANGGHPQPEVSGWAWKQFIKDKQIRVGDELVFYLPPPPAVAALHQYHYHEAPPVFLISVRREIRLLGSSIPAHIHL